MIIIEGIDATGKSSLAQKISDHTGWPIKESEGPEKFPGEIITRMKLYLGLPHTTIFDRHPVISQCIYGPLKKQISSPPFLLQELKRVKPLIIQASSINKGAHKVKEYDTPSHINLIESKKEEIIKAYDLFMEIHFPKRILYTFENTYDTIKQAIYYARRPRDFDL
jgi:hypothetical protein